MSDFTLNPELLADSGLGLVVYAPTAEATVVNCNSLAAGWFGFTRAGLEGKTALDSAWSFLEAEERPLPRDDLPVFRVLASGEAVRNVRLGILAAGSSSPRWVQASAVPQRGADGAIEYVVMTLTEPPAEVSTRPAYSPTDFLMEISFDSTGDGIFLSNADGSVVKFNPTFAHFNGIRPTESATSLAALSESVVVFDRHGSIVGLSDWPVSRALRGETGELEAKVYRPDSNQQWTAVYHYAPLRNADRRIIGAIVTCGGSIVQRHALEKSLRASTQRFETLVEGAPDGIFISNKGSFTYANPALLKILGLKDPADFLGTNSFDWVAPEFFGALRQRMQEVMRGEAWPPSFWELLRRDGTRVPVEVTGTRLDEDCHVGFIRDISARMAAAVEQEKLRLELEATKRLESMGRLAGGLAHNFNNILQAQKLFFSVMKLKVDQTSEKARIMEDLESCTDRASEIVRQLLAFGRKQVGKPATVDLNEVVLNIASLLQSSVAENILFQITPAPMPLWVNVDVGQIEQIMLNLVLNARDAMEEGGRLDVRLAAETDQSDGSPQALISVIDTGIGISDAGLERIFEPFFTTKPDTHGGGLGLASVHALVAQNEGRIAVSSRLGAGTQFDIHLPLVSEAPRQHAMVEGAAPPLRAGQSKRILLVEDDAASRGAIRQVLEQLGHQVMEAADGAAALSLMAQPDLPPQLVVTDLVMPKMNGRELATRLRERFTDLPVIYISGHTEGLISRNGVLDSAVNFLAKPFSAEQLQRMIASVDGE